MASSRISLQARTPRLCRPLCPPLPAKKERTTPLCESLGARRPDWHNRVVRSFSWKVEDKVVARTVLDLVFQHLIGAAPTVPLQVKGDVGIAHLFQQGCNFAGHFLCQKPRHLRCPNFDAGEMKG